MLKIKRWPVFTGVVIVLLALTVDSSFGADKRRGIRGNTPAAVARLHALGNFPATNELHLAIALPLRNQAELDALLKNLYDPASASYRHYLTPGQFAEKFGPSKSDYSALIKFAQQNGLKVTGTHPNRVVLDVAGSVADIENIFQIKLHIYRHPKESRMFYAPDTEPSVDANVPVQILSVSGLNNYSLPQPADLHVMPVNQSPGATPNSGSGSGGTYRGLDFRTAYVPGTPLTGTGQSVALLEFDGYYSNDITYYESVAQLPAVTLVNIPVNNGVSTPSSNTNHVLEVSLDIEMAISMAPGLSSVLVYEAPINTPWLTMLTQIADDDLAAQIGCSWGGGSPDPASEVIFQQMASQGQSFFSASGDSDVFVMPVSFPDESPNITMVGGTTLTTTGPSGSRVSEKVWNWGGGVGSSGGISTDFSIPVWQQGINSFLTNGGSTTARNIPDVALTADNIYVRYENGLDATGVGGTSCAAPLWAGFIALVNQQAASSNQSPVGFINPAVYEIANESIYSSAFFDITKGNNTSSSSPNAFFAVPGYDLCTGLGTPGGTNLINALVSPDPLIVVSNGGFRATSLPGGGFSLATQNYYLTNVGASTLIWSLGNTSAWLNASGGGGTLAPGDSTPVVVSLNTVASNLNVGTYSTYLWFSNNTSGVAHSRFFTLKVSNSLLQNGDFETGDFSDWTLVGNPNIGTTIYNKVVGVNGLADGSGPNFIHSGTYGAFLGDTSLASLSQTIQTVPGQSYLLSFWLDNPQGGAGQQFLVNWNTNSTTTNQIYSANNPGVLAWKNLTFVVRATDTNGTLQFREQNLPDGFGLDDVSIIAVFAPAFTAQPPTNLTVLAGSTVTISAATTGSAPLAYRWRKNGVNLANGGGVSGATTTNLMLTSVTTNNTANYSLVVTNAYGAITSSVTTLTVVQPPAIATSLTNQTIECGNNANFAVTAFGTAPLIYQWSVDGSPVSDATNSSFALTNVHMTGHLVAVTVGNLYGSVTNTALLTVQDTLGPVITLNGANPIYVELGGTFADPGATANDACAGPVTVVTTGLVNPNVVGTNLLTYTSTDGNGNTNTILRSVIVMDTTPPTIVWSFTNLVLALDTNCTAVMPDVTGTNYILATDLSGALTISQNPTNSSTLTLGTNMVVITVADASGNDAYSTNTIVVQDQIPPVILSQPPSRTNFVGSPANFSVVATACTPLAYQWQFNNLALTDETNSTLTLASVALTNAGNYSVIVTAAGGLTNSAVAVLTVLNPALFITGESANPDGSFTLNLAGAPGSTYILMTTSNLFNGAIWQPIATNVFDNTGIWQFNDVTATNFAQRFYRLEYAP